MNLLERGIGQSFRGLRTGDASLLALGIAMLFFGWLRKSKPTRTRIYRKELEPGQEITIRFTAP